MIHESTTQTDAETLNTVSIEALDPEQSESGQTLRSAINGKVVLAGIVGNVIEWYDFALFGYFAPILSTLFFPSQNSTASLLGTYGIFAAGFLMRPIGAIIFGYIGDQVGRRQELFISVILMAIPTFLLGLIPDYDHIGIAAPILLILLRLVQGLSVGGEITGSITYVAETAPQMLRGFTTSFAGVGATVGTLLGSGIAASVTTSLPAFSVEAWGWRLPFLVGGLLGLVGFYIRKSLPISEIFQEHHEAHAISLLGALKQNLASMLQAILFSCGLGAMFYISMVYLPTYLAQFTAISLSQALFLNTLALTVLMAFTPLFGWVSDRMIRRKPLLILGSLSLVLVSYPAFWLLQRGNIIWIGIAQISFALLISILFGAAPAMFVELFPTEARLTGYSVSYNLGLGTIGGTAPLLSTWFIGTTGNVYFPALYLIGLMGVATIALSFITDRSREPLL